MATTAIAWRAKKQLALGIDPYLLCSAIAGRPALPARYPFRLGCPLFNRAAPRAIPVFNTVFSMGVLYHRRSPLDHLLEPESLARKGNYSRDPRGRRARGYTFTEGTMPK